MSGMRADENDRKGDLCHVLRHFHGNVHGYVATKIEIENENELTD